MLAAVIAGKGGRYESSVFEALHYVCGEGIGDLKVGLPSGGFVAEGRF